MSATAVAAVADAREAIAAEVREVLVGAIDSAIRELEVSIRYLQLHLRELGDVNDALRSLIDLGVRELEVEIYRLVLRKLVLGGPESPPFVRVFPPREGSI